MGAGGCLTRRVFRCIKGMLIDANHAGRDGCEGEGLRNALVDVMRAMMTQHGLDFVDLRSTCLNSPFVLFTDVHLHRRRGRGAEKENW